MLSNDPVGPQIASEVKETRIGQRNSLPLVSLPFFQRLEIKLDRPHSIAYSCPKVYPSGRIKVK